MVDFMRYITPSDLMSGHDDEKSPRQYEAALGHAKVLLSIESEGSPATLLQQQLDQFVRNLRSLFGVYYTSKLL